MDILKGVTNLIDDFFYTPQEQAADEAKKLAAQAAIAQAQTQTAQAENLKTYLLYGLAAVAIVAAGVIAYRLIR